MEASLNYSSYDNARFRERVEQSHRIGRRYDTTSELAWLKHHVSGIDIGEHFSDAPRPIHCNTNDRVLKHFKSLADGEKSFLSFQWNWDKVMAHHYGMRKLYFAGNGESTLVMIDVDCKRRERPKGHAGI